MTLVAEIPSPENLNGINPFLVYIEQVEEEFLPVDNNLELLNRQKEFDGAVVVEYDEPEVDLYRFVFTDEMPNDSVVKLLRKYEADTKHNEKPETVKKRITTDLTGLITVAFNRPHDPNVEAFSDRDFKLELLKSFKKGEINLKDLISELDEYVGAIHYEKVLDSDYAKLSGLSACLGLGRLMVSERGENVGTPKNVCLGCRAISSCAVVTFASPVEIGVRAGLSLRERKAITSGVGHAVIRKMLSDPKTTLFRRAIGDIFEEYQEVINPKGFTYRRSSKKGVSESYKQNKVTQKHLEKAMTELARIYTL